MYVAIPLFGEEVSPRVGPRNSFLIASIAEGRICDRQIVEARNIAWPHLPEFLVSLGVTKVVCGGIGHELEQELERQGIEVVWGVIGPASDALSALAEGTLHSDQFVRRGGGSRKDSSAL